MEPGRLAQPILARASKHGSKPNSALVAVAAPGSSFQSKEPGPAGINPRRPLRRATDLPPSAGAMAFLAIFMGNSTHFFGFGTISTARDPRYMKIGASSKLIDLVIYGRFHGQ